MSCSPTLDRRRLLLGAGSLLAAATLSRPSFAGAMWSGADYDGALVIDAQGALGGAMDETMLRAIHESGVTAISRTVGRVGSSPGQFRDSVAEIARITQLCRDHPQLTMIRTHADLVEAKRAGRLGIICNFQDTSPLEANLDHVALFKRLGVRVIQLTYNTRNLAGDGAIEKADAGISEYGRRVIAEIESEQVLLDLSHGGRRTIADAIAAAQRPMTISHTGCRALVDLARNVDDAALRAVAEKGGVVGIYLMPFLRESGQPRAADLLRHLEHAINVCGEDHVGIGTDGTLLARSTGPEAYERQRRFYESRKERGIAAPGEAPDVLNLIPEYNSPRRFFDIAAKLADRSHSSRRIGKILGGNFARLFREVWPREVDD